MTILENLEVLGILGLVMFCLPMMCIWVFDPTFKSLRRTKEADGQ